MICYFADLLFWCARRWLGGERVFYRKCQKFHSKITKIEILSKKLFSRQNEISTPQSFKSRLYHQRSLNATEKKIIYVQSRNKIKLFLIRHFPREIFHKFWFMMNNQNEINWWKYFVIFWFNLMNWGKWKFVDYFRLFNLYLKIWLESSR